MRMVKMLSQVPKSKMTRNGVTWHYICKSGLENPDSSFGVFAGDEESYSLFWDQFKPILADCHYGQLALDAGQARCQHKGSNFQPPSPVHLAPVLTTRIRLARNLKGWPFPSSMTTKQRLQVHHLIETILRKLPGTLFHLDNKIPCFLDQKLQKYGFLFDNSDRFTRSANIFSDWPRGRSIFVSQDWHTSVWINEEDHLRLMCVVPGLDFQKAVSLLLPVLRFLETHLSFAQHQQLGFLTSCPTNLGTGCRISVHADCSPKDIDYFKSCGLAVRSQYGERFQLTTYTDGIYDISVTERLGITESQIMNKLQQYLVNAWG